MKKTWIAISLFILIFAFAGIDYALNVNQKKVATPIQESSKENPEIKEYNFTLPLIQSGKFNYTLFKRNRTQEIFEKFDLSSLENIKIYKNVFKPNQKEYANDLITAYEIQGGEAQGGYTYLNLKLKVMEQIGESENINETNKYGYNSFFYNDINRPNTAFIVTQIKDNVFAFEYNKLQKRNFEKIKEMIDFLMKPANL